MTDDILCSFPVQPLLKGKEEVKKALEEMKSDDKIKMTLHTIITRGSAAAANGEMVMTNAAGTTTTIAFCDMYTFSGFKNPKVKSLTSYVIELKN